MSAIIPSRAKSSVLRPRASLTHDRLQQIRKCLREWDLSSSPSSSANPELKLDVPSVSTLNNTELQIDTQSASDGWELVNSHSHTHSLSRTRLSSSSNLPFPPDSPTYTPSPATAEFDPETINLYKERPLPSLPTTSKHKRKFSTSLDRPTKDKLKLTCHHGAESHEVEMTLGILGQGPSPIETYASDDQSHERIAVGLERKRGPSNPDLDDSDLDMPFRKAECEGNGVGIRLERRQRKRSRKGKRRESEGH